LGAHKGDEVPELDEIRSVFPNWPSELDVAKTSTNWASRAQAFYSGVLNDELNSAHNEMHSRAGQVLEAEVYLRQQTQLPAEFCLAFSLELAVKAALVKQGKLEELSSGQNLPFGNHLLHILAKQLQDFQITEELLKWASATVLNGKYPVRKRPSDSENGVTPVRSLTSLIHTIDPLYHKLMGLSCS